MVLQTWIFFLVREKWLTRKKVGLYYKSTFFSGWRKIVLQTRMLFLFKRYFIMMKIFCLIITNYWFTEHWSAVCILYVPSLFFFFWSGTMLQASGVGSRNIGLLRTYVPPNYTLWPALSKFIHKLIFQKNPRLYDGCRVVMKLGALFSFRKTF